MNDHLLIGILAVTVIVNVLNLILQQMINRTRGIR